MPKVIPAATAANSGILVPSADPVRAAGKGPGQTGDVLYQCEFPVQALCAAAICISTVDALQSACPWRSNVAVCLKDAGLIGAQAGVYHHMRRGLAAISCGVLQKAAILDAFAGGTAPFAW